MNKLFSRLIMPMMLALVVMVSVPAAAQVNIDYSTRAMNGGFFAGLQSLASPTHKVTKMLSGSITHDFASQTITCADSAAITVTGAATGDACFVGAPAAAAANASFTCYVSAANTVLVRCCAAGTAVDPPSATYTVRVISNQ